MVSKQWSPSSSVANLSVFSTTKTFFDVFDMAWTPEEEEVEEPLKDESTVTLLLIIFAHKESNIENNEFMIL